MGINEFLECAAGVRRRCPHPQPRPQPLLMLCDCHIEQASPADVTLTKSKDELSGIEISLLSLLRDRGPGPEGQLIADYMEEFDGDLVAHLDTEEELMQYQNLMLSHIDSLIDLGLVDKYQ